jgi:hypothetical protein
MLMDTGRGVDGVGFRWGWMRRPCGTLSILGHMLASASYAFVNRV